MRGGGATPRGRCIHVTQRHLVALLGHQVAHGRGHAAAAAAAAAAVGGSHIIGPTPAAVAAAAAAAAVGEGNTLRRRPIGIVHGPWGHLAALPGPERPCCGVAVTVAAAAAILQPLPPGVLSMRKGGIGWPWRAPGR
jgi:hypothetical protein